MPLMNAPFLLHEIVAALRNLAAHGERRTLFLSQFPMSEEDALFLQKFLGRGRTTIQMSGDHPTIWRESATPGVWWGEYYDGPKKIALRTIEIAHVPELALTPADEVREGITALEQRIPEATADFVAEGESSCTRPA
jgi:hydrogenase-1 operon protein HyaF